VLGDVKCQAAYDSFVRLLEDPSPRVRFFAAMGLGHVGKKEAVAPLLAMLARAEDKDPYIRHAGGFGLAGCGDTAALVKASKNPSFGARVGALLALRRMGRWEVASFLHDSDPRIVLE